MNETSSRWYALLPGRQIGPMDEADLRARCRSGEVPPATLVWTAGMPDWRPAADCAPLADLFEGVAGTPTAHPWDGARGRGIERIAPATTAAGHGGLTFDAQRGRARGLRMLLWLLWIAQVMVTGMDIAGRRAIAGWPNDVLPEESGVEMNGQTALFISFGFGGLLSLILFVAVVLTFCRWIHRANRNARALGALDMEYTPGWAVGWFFIPVANLVMPYLVMLDIYQASDPSPADRTARPARRIWLVPAWWLTWVLMHVVAALGHTLLPGSRMEGRGAAIILDAVHLLLMAAATWLVIRVIDAIQQRQLAKAQAVRSMREPRPGDG